jgi:hypothetical protein
MIEFRDALSRKAITVFLFWGKNADLTSKLFGIEEFVS